MARGFARMNALTLSRRIGAWFRNRAGERALMELDDHRLRDLGLRRDEIHAAAYGIAPLRNINASVSCEEERRPAPRRLPLAAAVAGVALVSALTAAADTPADRLPTVADLPPGTIRVSPPIPGMGEHWANPKDLPLGPIYCVMNGKVICAEFMVLQEAFIRGKSFERLRLGMEGKLPPVNHLEMTFMPHGHEGFEVPHYDVHMYFVPPDARFPAQARQ
jgi:uncharacterized protein YjiS (DUF1127 family)